MAGGYLQLLARGAQDNILVGNPQISFFKIVYRRYTNFSMETIKLDPVGQEISATSNTTINCDIKRNADLLTSVYFTFELPAIYSGSDDSYAPYEFKWIDNIGTNIIDNTRLLIGGTEVDRHTGQFLNILTELRLNETEKKIHNELIGNVPELYNPTTTKDATFIPVLDSATGGLGTDIDYINNNNTYNVYYDTDSTIGTFTISGVDLTLTGDTTFQPIANFYIGDYIRLGKEETGTTGTKITWTYDETGGASEDLWTSSSNHGLIVGDTIVFDVNGGGAANYAIDTTYYVVSKTTTTVTLSATSGGSAIAGTGDATGWESYQFVALADNANATDGFYIGYQIKIGNELRTIKAYNGSAKTAYLNAVLTSSAATQYTLSPPRREIIAYSSNKVVTVAAWDSVVPTVATNGGNCIIERGNGRGMTVALTKESGSAVISSITILDEGVGYRDHDKLYIDMDDAGATQEATDPTFYLLKSRYPHIHHTNTSVGRQFTEFGGEPGKNIVKNSDASNIFTNLIPSIPKRKIKVPLKFFFSSEKGMALPLISLQYHETNIEITLKKISDLFTVVEKNDDQLSLTTVTETVTSFNRRKTTATEITTFISTSEFKINYGLEANYIFLDSEERRRFAANNQDYLIQELQIVKITDVVETSTHDLQLYHPVKELIIVPQRTDMPNINNWNNYTNWTDETMAPYSSRYLNNERHYLNRSNANKIFYNKHYNPSKTTDADRNFEMQYFRKNIINKIELLFNGQVRQRINDTEFYNKVQPFEHHKTAPKDGINVNSFSLNPNETQPSGACNFSRISNFQIKLDLGIENSVFAIPETNGTRDYKYDIYVYAINYNVLKIASGMGAKQFAN